MGTDIHSIAQVKRDGKWVTVAIGIAGDIRSYNTFAMLANVRNGRGFAGVRTSTGFPVIHEPRGLPNDLDRRVVGHSLIDEHLLHRAGRAVDSTGQRAATLEDFLDRDEDNGVIVDKAQLVCAWDWDGKEQPVYLPEDGVLWLGDHSFSWCTLAELRAFIENVAKKTQTHLCGIVTREEYLAHETTGKPYESWCGGLDGPGIFVAGRIGVVYEEGGLPDFYTHVQTSWPVNAAEHSMLNEIEAALTLVATRTGTRPEDLRFVYGFDS